MECAACRYTGDFKMISGIVGRIDTGTAYHQNIELVNLYVCPECKTVRLQEY